MKHKDQFTAAVFLGGPPAFNDHVSPVSTAVDVVTFPVRNHESLQLGETVLPHAIYRKTNRATNDGLLIFVYEGIRPNFLL